MKIWLLLIVTFVACSCLSQTKNNVTTGTTFVPDPSYANRVLEKWNYQYKSPAPVGKADSTTSLGKLIFWMAVPVKTDTGYWKPHCTFDIYKKGSKDYCHRLSEKIKDNPNCPPDARGGDIYTAGDYIFVNNENCPDCVAIYTGANFCKSHVRLIFKNTKVQPNTPLQDLIAALPVQPGVY